MSVRSNVDRWAEIEFFVTVANELSMTRAADVLGVSVSSVSRNLMATGQVASVRKLDLRGNRI
ncbi:LysR family transcriptional regulator [Agrobacterium tumefaciens]|uniref:LysR family transcriptional regulator n=1 Tax=Agrobacterium tumefaciens TaxID=358 RepID=UPI0015746818|nr:LysR family transcriptional regulator [Agrobacterium tumefaciens]